MNKQIIILTLSLLIPLSFYAQKYGSDYKKVKLGLMVTPQLSWLTSDHASVLGDGPVLGISYGLLADLFFSRNYAISVAVLRSHSGGKIKMEEGMNARFNVNSAFVDFDHSETIRYNMNFIEIPVGLKLKTKLFRRIGYYGQLGLTPMITTKTTNSNGNKLIKEVQVGNLGFHFGGGTEYSLGGDTYLHIALFYTNGLFDMTTNGDINDKSILNSVNLRLGINF